MGGKVIKGEGDKVTKDLKYILQQMSLFLLLDLCTYHKRY